MLIEQARALSRTGMKKHLRVLPMYAGLPSPDQMKVFERVSHSVRKVRLLCVSQFLPPRRLSALHKPHLSGYLYGSGSHHGTIANTCHGRLSVPPNAVCQFSDWANMVFSWLPFSVPDMSVLTHLPHQLLSSLYNLVFVYIHLQLLTLWAPVFYLILFLCSNVKLSDGVARCSSFT